jgi:hypothetical protein
MVSKEDREVDEEEHSRLEVVPSILLLILYTAIPFYIAAKSELVRLYRYYIREQCIFLVLKFKICSETRGYLLIGHSNITNHGYKYYQLTLIQKITSNRIKGPQCMIYRTPSPFGATCLL